MSTSCSMYLKPRESACVASNPMRALSQVRDRGAVIRSGPDLDQMVERAGWRMNWVPMAETVMRKTPRVQAGECRRHPVASIHFDHRVTRLMRVLP